MIHIKRIILEKKNMAPKIFFFWLLILFCSFLFSKAYSKSEINNYISSWDKNDYLNSYYLLKNKYKREFIFFYNNLPGIYYDYFLKNQKFPIHVDYIKPEIIQKIDLFFYSKENKIDFRHCGDDETNIILIKKKTYKINLEIYQFLNVRMEDFDFNCFKIKIYKSEDIKNKYTLRINEIINNTKLMRRFICSDKNKNINNLNKKRKLFLNCISKL